MRVARQVSTRSTCLRRKVGAIIVRDKRILSTGYNGAPRGLPHCADVGCLREAEDVPSGQRHELCRGLHAEMNAIIQAACYGASISGGVLYSTTQPCVLCAKMIINAGLTRVVIEETYPDKLAESMLADAKIEIVRLDANQESSGDKR